MLPQDQMIIVQQYVSICFITELYNNNFLESQFFNDMKFDNESIKDCIKAINIDSDGMFLIFLYSLLLIPKEKIYDVYKDEYDALDKKIDGLKIPLDSTYPASHKKYIRHIRNAIAHGKVEFKEDSIFFNDDYRGNQFCVEIPRCKIGDILTDLQKILLNYVTDLKNGRSF